MKRLYLFLFLLVPSCVVGQTNPHVTQLQTFESITALRAAKPVATGTMAIVRGEAGGEFFWSPTESSSDNGGTIILPTGYTTGRWVRSRPSGEIRFSWFGPDGTDDHVELQKAADALESGGKFFCDVPTIHMSAGVWFSANNITVDFCNTVATFTGTSFSGDYLGMNAAFGFGTKTTTASLAADFAGVPETQNITVKNLTAEGVFTGDVLTDEVESSGFYSNSPTDVFSFVKVRNFRVENCHFRNIRGQGIMNYANVGYNTIEKSSFGVIRYHAIASNRTSTSIPSAAVDRGQLTIRDCEFKNLGSFCADYHQRDLGSETAGLIFENNKIENHSIRVIKNQVYLDGYSCGFLVMRNNVFRHNPNRPYVGGTDARGWLQDGSYRSVEITGNVGYGVVRIAELYDTISPVVNISHNNVDLSAAATETSMIVLKRGTGDYGESFKFKDNTVVSSTDCSKLIWFGTTDDVKYVRTEIDNNTFNLKNISEGAGQLFRLHTGGSLSFSDNVLIVTDVLATGTRLLYMTMLAEASPKITHINRNTFAFPDAPPISPGCYIVASTTGVVYCNENTIYTNSYPSIASFTNDMVGASGTVTLNNTLASYTTFP